MADLINIQGLFADILPDPRKEQEEQLMRNVGLFQAGLPGALGQALTRFQNESRGQLQNTVQAINPALDVRTADQRFRSAVNAIDPEDPDAERKYIEATKQFMPSKLPQLMESIRARRLEDEALERTRAAEGRAVSAESRAEELHTVRMRQGELSNDLTDLQIEAFKEDQQQQADAREFLKNSTYAKRQGADYADGIDQLSPERLMMEVQTAMSQDEVVRSRLSSAVKAALPDDSPLADVLDDFSVEELRIVLQQEANAKRPDWRVVTDQTGTVAINMAAGENMDSTRIRITSATPPRYEPSEKPTESVVEGVRQALQDQNVDRKVANAFGLDSLGKPENMAAIYQLVRDDLISQQLPSDVQSVTNEIVRRASMTDQEITDEAASIYTDPAFNPGTGF